MAFLLFTLLFTAVHRLGHQQAVVVVVDRISAVPAFEYSIEKCPFETFK